VAYACLEVCLSQIDETLCFLLQGELVSLFEFGAWFDFPWFQGEYGLLLLRNFEFWLLFS
jgi:hypothetical protein